MLDFLATPFILLAQVSLYIAAFITGKIYFLIQAEHEEDE